MRIPFRAGVVLVVVVAPMTAWAVGLSPVGSHQLLNGPLAGGLGPQELDEFGTALAAGDLDGDGFVDLAVGVPYDSGPLAAPVVSSGSVRLYRGGLTGVPTQPYRVLTQAVGGALGAGDQHGRALAICDFNDDGFADLAIGAPGDFLAATAAGTVFVHAGTPGGPNSGASQVFTQDSPGIPETAESNDRFGAALACGDFDGDGFADLAIGAPAESLGDADFAGAIVVLYGAATGLSGVGSIGYTQADAAIPGAPEDEDAFGASLAAGDLDGDGFDDLAIGVPGEDLTAGAMHVLFGGPGGIDANGSMLLTDEALSGLSEIGDEFGRTVVFGDFEGDGFDDLVIGIPHETFASSGGPIVRAGQIVVVSGHAAIPTLGAVDYWAENNIFGAGTSETSDDFGAALAVGDFNGDGFDDLAAGHPGEVLESDDDGALTVLHGSMGGLTPTRARRFEPTREGVPGAPLGESPERHFGAALAAGDFDGDGHADLALGSPAENGFGLESVGTATILYGALFADGFESGHTGRWSPQS